MRIFASPMNLFDLNKQAIFAAFAHLFDFHNSDDIQIVDGKIEFDCDYTLILFPFTKRWSKTPEQIGHALGKYLVERDVIHSYSIVKGFFNYNLSDKFWVSIGQWLANTDVSQIVRKATPAQKIVIEYCSPNTNKPLHLGHVRNILLGWALKKILECRGHEVHTTQVINDRGIAICKSMLAWKLFGENATPHDAKVKGDHFIGQYYVLFEKKFSEEYELWKQSPSGQLTLRNFVSENIDISEAAKKYKNEFFNNESKLGSQARSMLKLWEDNDQEVLALWNQMNQWVYQGFSQTYKKLGVSFDSNYYESKTYLLGNDIIDEGLYKGIFYRLDDGSVWIDLQDIGMDKKLVRRRDGTAVYITQDLGTAVQRHNDLQANKYIYVVADEQDYHFKVLFAILKKLGYPFAESLFHLSYGMIELPTGRMKSREGTVVDADDLIEEVISEARSSAANRGELAMLDKEEQELIFQKIGMAALKYFILKVQAKKKMIFDPLESLDLQGNTGPYIVNAYVRIKSVMRKAGNFPLAEMADVQVQRHERQILRHLLNYSQVFEEVELHLDPALLANHLYAMAKDFHKFYHDYRILNAESENLRHWRLLISSLVMNYLEHGMKCLGIDMPDRM